MLQRMLRILGKAAEVASAVAFAAMFLLFLAGVFTRYVLNSPLVWSDELIMIIFLWMVFLTEAFVITEREQVTFDGIYELVGERWRRLILATGALLIAVMFLVALPTVSGYVNFLWRERTPALQWRKTSRYPGRAVRRNSSRERRSCSRPRSRRSCRTYRRGGCTSSRCRRRRSRLSRRCHLRRRPRIHRRCRRPTRFRFRYPRTRTQRP